MKYLASKKLALVLIIALAVISAAGMVVPQAGPGAGDYDVWRQGHAGIAPVVEALQLNRVFASWWIKIVYGLFFVNLAACTYLQVKRQAKVKNGTFPGLRYREIRLPATPRPEKIMRYLVSKRYKTVWEKNSEGGMFVRGSKWAFSRWSPVAFHVGLLIVVTGILVSGLARTDGIIPVMEGQTVTENSDSYVVLEKGILAGGHSQLPIKLDQVSLTTDPGSKTIKSETMDFTFGGENVRLDSKNPVTVRGFAIYRDRTGYSLTLGRSGPKGETGDFTFPLLMNRNEYNTYSNEINIPGTSYSVKATLFPNAVKNPGVPDRPAGPGANAVNGTAGLYRSDGNALLNPIVRITLENPSAGGTGDVYLAKGGTFIVGGTKLAVKDIGKWGSLRLVRDPGAPVIYAGCAVSVLALFIMYFFIPKQLYVRVGAGGTVETGGWAGRYSSLFRDEMEELLVFLTEGETERDSGTGHIVLGGC